MKSLLTAWMTLVLVGVGGAQEIVFENFTEQSGVRREQVPRLKGDQIDTDALKPGALYWDWPFDVFCGDLDGDGHADLFSADHHPSLEHRTPGAVWLGRGDGTFGANLFERAPVDLKGRGIGGGYGGVVDMDGDGRMDFYCFENGGIFLNRGVEGTGEARAVRLEAYTFGGWRGTIFADFNRDGNLDAATGADVFLGGGRGTLPAKDWKKSAQAAEAFAKWSDPLHHCIAADFRRSGALDILAGQAVWRWAWDQRNWEEVRAKAVQPRGLFFVNDGKGNFTEAAEAFGLAEMSSCGPVTAADFNNDGFFDVFSVGLGNPDKPSKARLYVNRGGKRFEMKDAPELGIALTPKASGIPLQYCCSSAADLNNDGLMDLIVGDGTTYKVRVFRNTGDLRFQEEKVVASGRGGQCRFAVADFNEDGLLDVAVNGGTCGVEVHLNRSHDAGGWLEVAVKGTDGNPNGVGALVEVFAAGKLRETTSLIGMQHVVAENQNHVPLAPHFGLGKAPAVDVRVTLPTGEVLEAKRVKAGSRVLADFASKKIQAR